MKRQRLIVALCVLVGATIAAAGTILLLDADISIHNKVSIAASGSRIDTVVFIPLRSGSTTDRRGPSLIALTWASKITTASSDSVPSMTLRPIIGGVPSNLSLIPTIVDSLWGRPPVQSATWRAMTWFVRVTADSYQVVVRNYMVAAACSSGVSYQVIGGD